MLYPIEFLGEFIIPVVCLVSVWGVMNWNHCRRIHALMQWLPRRKIAFEAQCDTIHGLWYRLLSFWILHMETWRGAGNGRWVKYLFLYWNVQKVGRMILASLLHHVEDENLETLVVAALVCSCQCDFGNRLTSYTKKLTLELVRFQNCDGTYLTFMIWERSKYHCKWLVLTLEMFRVLVSIIFANNIIEVVSV